MAAGGGVTPFAGPVTEDTDVTRAAAFQRAVETWREAQAATAAVAPAPSVGDLPGPVVVSARVRPLSAAERGALRSRAAAGFASASHALPEFEAVTAEPPRAVCLHEEVRRFGALTGAVATKRVALPVVFGPEDGGERVFRCLGAPLVDHALAGGRATCVAYGQTGSGKTTTVRCLQRLACDRIFDRLGNAARALSNSSKAPGGRLEPGSSNGTGGDGDFGCGSGGALSQESHSPPPLEMGVFVSYLELCGEKAFDLLRLGNAAASDKTGISSREGTVGKALSGAGSGDGEDGLCGRAAVTLRDDGAGDVHCSGLLELRCGSAAELWRAMERGEAGRRTFATVAHDRSSRSHAVCTITLRSCARGALGGTAGALGDYGGRDSEDKCVNMPPVASSGALLSWGRLRLVDLAGSERASDSVKHDAERLQETKVGATIARMRGYFFCNRNARFV